jgi:polar amino acid transport system permease protein
MTVVPLRHTGRWALAVVVLALTAWGLITLLSAPNLEPDVIWQYLFDQTVLHGVRVTLTLTVVAMVAGLLGGMILAVMRLSGNPVLRWIAWVFVWFFRGTPLLVQIIFFGFLGALFTRIHLEIPLVGLTLYDAKTSSVITGTTAALLALSLNEMAYAAEIVRGGILSIDKGQSEAAHALGMTPGLTMRRIVLPQAMRVIIPPLGNETITMLKSTALVSVIAGSDLLTSTQTIYQQNYKVIPLLTVAALWYLLIVSILSAVQVVLERRFGRGFSESRGGAARRRWFGGARREVAA